MNALLFALFVALAVLIILCPRVATGGVKPGIAAVGYRNTGTYGSPTWAAASIIRDATPAFPWDMVDASSRATRAKLYGKSQVDLGIQLVCRADDADTAYQAFVDAAFSATAIIDMLILDGPITREGARGVRAHWLFSLTGQPQGAGDMVYSTFDLKPGVDPSGNVPASVSMGASSTPAFTSF
jgi:hypothetical protein